MLSRSEAPGGAVALFALPVVLVILCRAARGGDSRVSQREKKR